MNRTRLTTLNFATSIGLRAVTISVSLVVTPLLIRFLGDTDFGAFRAAFDWIGYLALLEFGFEGALIPVFISALSRDHEDLNLIMAPALKIFALLTGVKLAAGLVLAYFIPQLVPMETWSRDLAVGAFFGVSTIIFTVATPFRTFLRAQQKSYVINALYVVQTVIVAAGMLHFAYRGFGITGQFWAIIIGGLIFHALLVGFGARNRRLNWRRCLSLVPRQPVPAAVHRLNLPTFAFDSATRVALMSDNIIGAFFLGPAAIVPMFLTLRLPQLLQNVMQEVGNASWASLADLHARGFHDVFNDRIVSLTKGLGVLGMVGMLPLLAFNQHFVALWVGSHQFGGMALNVVGALTAYSIGIIMLWRWAFTGTGRVRKLAPLSISNTTLNIGLSCYLTWRYGIIGPPLGTLLSNSLTSFVALPILMHRNFNTPVRPLMVAALKPLVILSPFGVLAAFFGGRLESIGWIGLLSSMTALAAAGAAFGYWFIWDLEERRFWRDKASGLFGQHKDDGPPR